MKFTYALNFSALLSVIFSKTRKLNRCIVWVIGYNGSNNFIQRKNSLEKLTYWEAMRILLSGKQLSKYSGHQQHLITIWILIELTIKTSCNSINQLLFFSFYSIINCSKDVPWIWITWISIEYLNVLGDIEYKS